MRPRNTGACETPPVTFAVNATERPPRAPSMRGTTRMAIKTRVEKIRPRDHIVARKGKVRFLTRNARCTYVILRISQTKPALRIDPHTRCARMFKSLDSPPWFIARYANSSHGSIIHLPLTHRAVNYRKTVVNVINFVMSINRRVQPSTSQYVLL